MATRTISTCDRCGAEGAKWVATLVKVVKGEVDLCDECFEVLKGLHKRFLKGGLDGDSGGAA